MFSGMLLGESGSTRTVRDGAPATRSPADAAGNSGSLHSTSDFRKVSCSGREIHARLPLPGSRVSVVLRYMEAKDGRGGSFVVAAGSTVIAAESASRYADERGLLGGGGRDCASPAGPVVLQTHLSRLHPVP